MERRLGFDVDAFYADAGSEISTKATIKAAFAEAAEWVKKQAGGRDGFLSKGSLDCSHSIAFLQSAIGRKFEPSKGHIWSADEVRRLAETAQWADPATVPDDELWAYWSARKFLEVCVQHGLGIWTN